MNSEIEIVFAETFTDIEQFEGTCYKAQLESLREVSDPRARSLSFPCSWPEVFERCSRSTVLAMSLINGKSIK